MPVADNAPRNQYVATSLQTAFSYTFEILAQTDIKVYQNGTLLTLTTHYTVSGVGDQNGGTVTLVTGATLDDEIVLTRDMALARTTDYQSGGALPPDTLDLDFDRILLGLQQIERDVSRSLRLAVADVFSNPDTEFVLPDSQTRASKFLSFDTTGKPSVAQAIAVNAEALAAVESIALLKAISVAGLTDGDFIEVTGYYAAGDGGGGKFYYDALSSATDNGGTVHQPDSGAGRWLRVVEGSTVTIQQFGADGSGDDTAFIQAAVDAGYSTVLANDITCGLTTTLTIPANTVLTGDGTFNFTGTPDVSTTAAIVLSGAKSAVEGLSINVTAGDYRRTVQLRANNCRAQRNLINVTTNDIPVSTAHYVFFAAEVTPMTGLLIADNDVQMTNVPIGDGVQASFCPGIKVLRNRFHDITLDVPNQEYWGIYISQQCDGALVAFNEIHTTTTGGIHLNSVAASENKRVRIIGNTIRDVQYNGIGFSNSFECEAVGNTVQGAGRCVLIANTSERILVANNVFAEIDTAIASDAALIASNGKNCSFVGNVFGDRGNAVEGIEINGTGCLISGNQFGDARPRKAIVVVSTAVDSCIVGNMVEASDDSTTGSALDIDAARCAVVGNRVINGTAAGWIGIRVGDSNIVCRSNVISGCATGIFVTGSTSSIVEGNQITGQSGVAISDSGTTTRVRGNVGWTTENSGTGSVASGATTAVITHGLSKTPTAANIAVVFTEQGSNDYGRWWVSSITSTQFTVNVSADPGASNLDFSWQAVVL